MPAVTRSQSPGAQRRAAVERRVLEAVDSLLASGASFSELSVQQIAEAAGVARSTFYVHFADKTELLFRLADAATAEIFAEADLWLTDDHRGGRTGLAQTFERIIGAYRRHGALLGAVVGATGYDTAVADYWRATMDAWVAQGVEWFRRAAAEGRVAAELDIEAQVRVAAWAIERSVSQHVLDHPPEQDPALARALARTIWLLTYGPA